MTTIAEGWFTVPADGTKLYTKTYAPANGEVKARIVHLHGFSDHSDTYIELLTSLATRGIAVHAFDQRGWGRSVQEKRQRGVTGPTSTVLADIDAVVCSVLAINQAGTPVPVFLVGHSMGGAEVLHFAGNGPASTRAQLRGYMVYGPLVRLHSRTRPWGITVLIGRVAGRLLPHSQMVNPPDKKLLSHDQAVGDRFAADDLCHDTGTLEGLAGMLDRGIALEQGQVVLRDDSDQRWAVWVAHGDDDQICDVAGTRQWYDSYCRVEDRTLRIWAGAAHRIHEDPEPTKGEFQREMGDWILARL